MLAKRFYHYSTEVIIQLVISMRVSALENYSRDSSMRHRKG